MSLDTASSARNAFAYRVVPHGDIWKVAIPGDSVPITFHARKDDAIVAALRLAKEEHVGVVVCNPDGSVETEITADAP